MRRAALFLFLIFNVVSTLCFSETFADDSLKKKYVKKNYQASNRKQNDILHTKLEVEFDWNKSQMKGKAYLTIKPYAKSTSRLYLNARGMEIKSLEVIERGPSKNQDNNLHLKTNEIDHHKKLKIFYKYENDSLKIDLGREFQPEEKYEVQINYIAKPNELESGGSAAIKQDKGLYFINPRGEEKNKMPQIWTQGETQANSAWFPTIDSPNEKMTSEIFMTVDSKYTTLSNGLLSDSKTNSDGSRTDHWKMDLPHSPYLVMMAVGEFKKVTDIPWNGKEISYYVEKEYVPYAKAIFGNTKEMIEFYSQVLGTPYPWQKYSQIVVRDYVSGAMENTSATLHGDFMVYQTDRELLDEKKGEAVIAHELFHQWFGDLVTAESWSNLPLNESFATYGEYLWEEYKNGRDAADARSYKSRSAYFKASTQKQVDLIRFDYENKEHMFDAWSYNKGGQVLHMLRKYVGDRVFFEALKIYLERNRFKNGEIHDLRLAFEEASGEDLNWFFNEWFLAKGHPELDIQKEYNEETKILTLKIWQKQNLDVCPIYTLPVDIDIYVNGKIERQRIVINEAEQEFKFKVESNPDLVNFDAEKQLLAIKNYSKSVEELVFQYKSAPLFSDRLEALSVLKNNLNREDVYAMYLYAAEKDNWFEHRLAAIEELKKMAAVKETDLKPLFTRMALTDKSTKVRAKTVEFLSENYKGPELSALYKKLSDEQSYLILSATLRALTKTDPEFALLKAKTLENEKTRDVFATIAYTYRKIGTNEHNDYFIKSKPYFSGNDLFQFLFSYSSFLKQGDKTASFEAAARIFSDIANESRKEDGILDFIKKMYPEVLLEPTKGKIEELKRTGGSPLKIKEMEDLVAKLEAIYKTIT